MNFATLSIKTHDRGEILCTRLSSMVPHLFSPEREAEKLTEAGLRKFLQMLRKAVADQKFSAGKLQELFDLPYTSPAVKTDRNVRHNEYLIEVNTNFKLWYLESLTEVLRWQEKAHNKKSKRKVTLNAVQAGEVDLTEIFRRTQEQLANPRKHKPKGKKQQQEPELVTHP
ncbi:hypothetical protein [Deinococcus roseus]|nr:hypothetical protein [Deinococcus roseus]